MDQYALIVAGGKGKRMGNAIPKQFLPLKNQALVFHTLDAFVKAIPNIKFVLVLPKEHIDFWKDLSKDSDYKKIKIVEGGKERTDSVQAGLNLIPDNAIVGIHDAVRPFVSSECILEAYETALLKGNAIPVIEQAESLRRIQGNVSLAVDRSEYRIVQTPQCFHADLIKNAYKQLKGKFTDDASVLEAKGEDIHLTKGNKENIKITEPTDLRIAEALLDRLNA